MAFYAVSVVLAAVFLFPVLWTVIRSLQGATADTQAPSLESLTELTFRSYHRLLETGAGMLHYAGNSALVAVGTAVGSVLLSTLAGYGFSRLRFRGSGLLFVVILTPFMVPFQGILAPLFTVLTWLHLSDSLLGLTLIYITFQLPFGVFIMSNSFAQVPRAIEEAALIDGLSIMGVLYRVLWRLVLPGIVTVALFAFLFAWNDFFLPLLYTGENPGNWPLSVGLSQFRTLHAVQWNLTMAATVLVMMPVVVLFFLAQRAFVEGVTLTGVKG